MLSPPISPRQSNTNCTCVNITWDTPLYDGAAPLTMTTISYRSTSNSSLVENTVTSYGDETSLEICDLVPNEVYNAPIVALNDAGPSTGVNFTIAIETPG